MLGRCSCTTGSGGNHSGSPSQQSSEICAQCQWWPPPLPSWTTWVHLGGYFKVRASEQNIIERHCSYDALLSKTTQNRGRYQHSCPGCMGWATSACAYLNIFSINSKKLSCICGRFSNERRNETRQSRSCFLLLGSHCLCKWKRKGARRRRYREAGTGMRHGLVMIKPCW